MYYYLYNLLGHPTYPKLWKQSRPVYKSDDETIVKNYRPMALSSNFAKVFETITFSILYCHVCSEIVPRQHFLKVTPMLQTYTICEFTDFVYETLDKRLQVDVIYIDLPKAFDEVISLYFTSTSFGVCKNLLQLLKFIIIGRFQYVECNVHILFIM